MDKMREEFEEWFNEIGSASVLADTMKDDAGNYYFPETRLLWACWQASRQALVVELPKNGEPVFKNDFAEGVVSGADIYRVAVEYALDKQGIKYK